LPDRHSIGRQIPLPKGKRWVVGDIHGCHKTFLKLLDQIQLGADDQLFLLGDFINKGPESLAVLEEIINFSGDLYPLLGNHDKIFLDYYTEGNVADGELLHSLNSSVLVDADASTKEKIATFYRSLPYYLVSGDIILVHAGFNFELDDIFRDTDAMLTIKRFEYDPRKISGMTVVHGHFPTPLDQIKKAIRQGKKVIPLDNGCVYRGNLSGIGNLLGLELNEMRLIVQPNVDQT